jgi:hypothetical protein
LQDLNAWWSDEQIFTNMHDRTGIDFIAAADTVNDTFPFESVENVGRLPRDKFYDLVGHSKAVLGVGSPRLSPTPYEALCREPCRASHRRDAFGTLRHHC